MNRWDLLIEAICASVFNNLVSIWINGCAGTLTWCCGRLCWSWLSWESLELPGLCWDRPTPWSCWNKLSLSATFIWRTCSLAPTSTPERWVLTLIENMNITFYSALQSLVTVQMDKLLVSDCFHLDMTVSKISVCICRHILMAAVRKSGVQPSLRLWRGRSAWCLHLVSWPCSDRWETNHIHHLTAASYRLQLI